VARTVELRAGRAIALEVDGEPRPAVADLRAEVVPAAYRLLV
jgi:diacylglycerol kinase family enzyme